MSSDGRTVVELIRITDPSTGRDVERLRIKRDGYFLADVRSWDDATKLGVDIEDLRETLGKLPGQQGRSGSLGTIMHCSDRRVRARAPSPASRRHGGQAFDGT